GGRRSRTAYPSQDVAVYKTASGTGQSPSEITGLTLGSALLFCSLLLSRSSSLRRPRAGFLWINIGQTHEVKHGFVRFQHLIACCFVRSDLQNFFHLRCIRECLPHLAEQLEEVGIDRRIFLRQELFCVR